LLPVFPDRIPLLGQGPKSTVRHTYHPQIQESSPTGIGTGNGSGTGNGIGNGSGHGNGTNPGLQPGDAPGPIAIVTTPPSPQLSSGLPHSASAVPLSPPSTLTTSNHFPGKQSIVPDLLVSP